MSKAVTSGCLEVTFDKDYFYVSYYGSMNTKLSSVKERFANLYGKAAWDKVMPRAVVLHDDLTYLWVRRIERTKFETYCKRK